ncbi:hypothetical protein Ancab_009984 [Ancistrocladus abbreviatus]
MVVMEKLGREKDPGAFGCGSEIKFNGAGSGNCGTAEEKQRTFDEYEDVLEEKKKALLALKVEDIRKAATGITTPDERLRLVEAPRRDVTVMHVALLTAVSLSIEKLNEAPSIRKKP